MKKQIPRNQRGYTAPQAAKLSGVPVRTVQFWRDSEYFRPSIAFYRGDLHVRDEEEFTDEGGAQIRFPEKTERYYSFGDLVGLKVVRDLIDSRFPRDALAQCECFFPHSISHWGEEDEGWNTFESLYIVPNIEMVEDRGLPITYSYELTKVNTLFRPGSGAEVQEWIAAGANEGHVVVPLGEELKAMKAKVEERGSWRPVGKWML